MTEAHTREKVLLRVMHRTRFDYSAEVSQAHSEVRKTPPETGLQHVVSSTLSVLPPTTVAVHRDYFGNIVHHFNILEPHSCVEIVAESIVETTDDVCCGPEAAPDPRPWKERWSEYLTWSRAVPATDEYATIRHGVDSNLSAPEFLSALSDLGATFGERFRYDPEATHVHSIPKELFEQGGGVCQDLAHALIGVLRLAGVPSRYASGYIYQPSKEKDGGQVQGAAASHAWVQAWHPDNGWVGIDPTNNKLVDWQYVRAAIGRDYYDVQPVRGVFYGEAEQQLTIEVRVTRLGS
jgi:transglutaminase-like putative cysteine protease